MRGRGRLPAADGACKEAMRGASTPRRVGTTKFTEYTKTKAHRPNATDEAWRVSWGRSHAPHPPGPRPSPGAPPMALPTPCGGRGRPRSQVILVQGCGIGRGVRRVRARGLQRGQGWCRPGCPISVNLGLLHPRIRGTEHHGRPTKTRVHGHDPRPREDSLFRVFRVFRGSNPWLPSSTSHGFPSPTRGSTRPPRPRM